MVCALENIIRDLELNHAIGTRPTSLLTSKLRTIPARSFLDLMRLTLIIVCCLHSLASHRGHTPIIVYTLGLATTMRRFFVQCTGSAFKFFKFHLTRIGCSFSFAKLSDRVVLPDHPLAANFNLTDGSVNITVPNVPPRDDYLIVCKSRFISCILPITFSFSRSDGGLRQHKPGFRYHDHPRFKFGVESDHIDFKFK